MTFTFRTYAFITAFILAIFLATLYVMGRIPVCTCGFGLWSGAWESSSSQHVADPYSTSHVLHGVVFFWVLWVLRRKLSLGRRFLVALLLEIGWEILENSPLIINRYRTATAALGYEGDSIMNSFFDVVFMALGFWFASKFPWKWSLALFFVVELLMLYFVRDNLTLNVLMLLYPINAIRDWQMMGASLS